MSGITKNLLLALTFVCVIVLVVFCIQLIVINRGVDPPEQGSGISGDSGQGDEDPQNGDGEDGEDSEEGQGGAITAPPPPPRPTPEGTRHQLHVFPENNLIIYAREELFDFEEGDDWWFTYTGGGTATLEISHLMLLAQSLETIAETFLNNYTGSDDSVFTGEELIQGSSIWGYHVHAHHGIGRYEAWIHRFLPGDIALVFVIYYENDHQRDALYEVLSTMDLVNVGEAGAGIPDPDPDPDPPPGDD